MNATVLRRYRALRQRHSWMGAKSALGSARDGLSRQLARHMAGRPRLRPDRDADVTIAWRADLRSFEATLSVDEDMESFGGRFGVEKPGAIARPLYVSADPSRKDEKRWWHPEESIAEVRKFYRATCSRGEADRAARAQIYEDLRAAESGRIVYMITIRMFDHLLREVDTSGLGGIDVGRDPNDEETLSYLDDCVADMEAELLERARSRT